MRRARAADGPAGVGLSVRRGEGILGTRFGRRPVAAPVVRSWRRCGVASHAQTPLDLLSREPTRPRLRSSRRRCRPRVRAPDSGEGPAAVILLRRRGSDTPAGTGRSLRSARSSRSSRRASRPGRVSTRGRMSPPKDGTGGPDPVAGSTPRVRRQRAWRLRVACSRPRPRTGLPSLRPSRVRTAAGLVRATRPVDTSTLIGPATFTGAPGSPAAPSGGAPSGGGGGAGCGLAAVRGHQSGRSRHVHRRQRGELRGVVGHDAREPDRDLRPGRGIDYRCREQCHQHGRSGGERVDRMTTANCRLVASRLRPFSRWSPRVTQQLITMCCWRVEQRSDNREKLPRD